MAAAWGARRISAMLLLAALAAAAGRNVFEHHMTLLQTRQGMQQLAGNPQECGEDRKECNLDVRHNFYTLLEKLGKEPAYHRDRQTGIVIDDPAFFQGAYVDRPFDTILQPCAIQPFSVPALTGMPLLGALRSRDNGCLYDSYGYQYLPEFPDEHASEDPCALARARGLERVLIIGRKDKNFAVEERSCAAS